MITKKGSTKIVNFMTPGAGVLVLGHCQISHIVKLHYFFKISLLSQALIRQTNYIVMMNKKGSTKIVNLYSEYVLSSSISIYFTLISIVFKDYDSAFLCHC